MGGRHAHAHPSPLLEPKIAQSFATNQKKLFWLVLSLDDSILIVAHLQSHRGRYESSFTRVEDSNYGVAAFCAIGLIVSSLCSKLRNELFWHDEGFYNAIEKKSSLFLHLKHFNIKR